MAGITEPPNLSNGGGSDKQRLSNYANGQADERLCKPNIPKMDLPPLTKYHQTSLQWTCPH